ncbi:LAETG motif-containing sortase-dependent surface protein [Streptomyces sp. NPDC001793]|uniref:LAETG motif-containing sortase-dependent surface protein n=1 Tax=Streptomyces sp. NPDC001793 TaxID=3154657 RepID=UPI00331685AE
MKLRQALTAAAAATVIAPAAVLAAPAAAFAADVPNPPAHTGGTGAAKPGAEGGAEPGPETKSGKETGGTPATTSGGGSSDGDMPPGEQCALAPKHLNMAIKGLRSEFVAGADWSLSSITVTNTSDKAMERVRPAPYISSAEIVDTPYYELEGEFRNPVTGKWLSFEDATVDSVFTGFPVAAHSTVTLPLRVRATSGAKPGKGYAIIEGSFHNKDGSCGDSNHEEYHFKILPAGGRPHQPGKPSKPGRSAEPVGGGTTGGPAQHGATPQGGVQETSAKGHLAETGSSSALPTIALVGGVAMAVGAGAIISVRRRRATADGGPGTMA